MLESIAFLTVTYSAKHICRRYRRLRKSFGFSLEKVCEELNLKDKTHLSNIENHKAIPRLDTFINYLKPLKQTLVICPMEESGQKENKELRDKMKHYTDLQIIIVLHQRMMKRIAAAAAELKQKKEKRKRINRK